jgi:hypothetical protein
MYNYLQRAWSDSTHNVTLKDIKKVIEEVKHMDDEHGAFWVGVVDDEETVLETDKSLQVTAIFNGDDQNAIIKHASNWQQVELLYDLLLNGDFDKLRTEMSNAL